MTSAKIRVRYSHNTDKFLKPYVFLCGLFLYGGNMLDFQKELYEMREALSKARENRNITFAPRRPAWMSHADKLAAIFDDCDDLIQKGKVYYAAVVQANTLLFDKRSKEDCPAQVLFSTDPIFEKNPQELISVARMIYDGKECEGDIPKDLSEAIYSVRLERDRDSYTFSIIVLGKKVSFTLATVLVFRDHIPKKVLNGELLPILYAPRRCESVIILPKEYWTKNITKLFSAK